MPNELSQPLRGIIPPLLTPLTDEGTVDLAALERLLEYVIRGGVHGVFLLGTTGEGPSLPHVERRKLVRHACRIVDQRVPVLVGISDTVFEESVDLARFACEQGSEAVVAAPPYYFPVQQEELLSYYQRLVEKLPLPLVLYNMPAVAGNVIGWEILRPLAELENVVGLKDSSGDIDYFTRALEIQQFRPDFPVLVGPEHLLVDTVRLGGSGGVSGGANIHPSLLVSLYEAAMAGELDKVKQLQASLTTLGSIYSVGPRSISTVIARIKAAAFLLKLCNCNPAVPLLPVNHDELLEIERILKQMKLLAENETIDSGRPLHA